MDRSQLAEIEAFVGIGGVLSGKYRIERVLGVGGMGVVVGAEHLQLGERVAIKFLLPRPLSGEHRVLRFLREARAASRIKSAHVARVFDIDTRADGAPFIVMEYLQGETLGERLAREGRVAVGEIVDDLLEACEAVAEAHSLGIVHRDLKPANLFLARGSGGIVTIKVLDFGISKVLDADLHADPTTGDGMVGSPPYMSPEQLTLSASVDHRTDIWSLGTILYEALAAKPPFRADSFAQVCALVLQGRPEPLARLRPDVPPELSALVERCLDKDRERRFASIAELGRSLAGYASERGQRALEVIAAIARAAPQPAAESKKLASLPPPPESRNADSVSGVDTGTLTAAPEATARPTLPARGGQRPRRLWLGLVALALCSSLLLWLTWTERHPVPSRDEPAYSAARPTPARDSARPPIERLPAARPSGTAASERASPVAGPTSEPAAPARLRPAAGTPENASRPATPNRPSTAPAARPTNSAPAAAADAAPPKWPKVYDPVYDERR